MTEPISFGRPFVLRRDRDISGVSGTGIILDGVLWPDGQAVIHWRGKWALTTPHPDGMGSILDIHDHGGQGDLHVIWADHHEQRRKNLAGVVEAFDVPAELCGTEAEKAYLHRQLERAIQAVQDGEAAPVEVGDERIVEAVMPIVGQLLEQRDRWRNSVGRAYGLAYRWQGAHGSSMFLVRTAGAELLDALNEDQADDAMTPATTCSARYTGVLPVGECIRAAGHSPFTDHTDDSGRHWGDRLAEYPVDNSQAPPNQGPLTGVEVRDPCPYCTGAPLFPRAELGAHVQAKHARVLAVLAAGGSLDEQLRDPETRCRLPHEMEV